MQKNRATAFMLFLLLYNVAYGIILGVIVEILQNTDISTAFLASPWFIIFHQLTAILLPLFIWLAIKKDRLRKHLPNQKMDVISIIIIVAISFAIQPVMMFISGLTSMLVPNNAAEMLTAVTQRGSPWLVMMLAIAVTPGIVEELVFRGYIQSVTPKRTMLYAVMLNGLLFGIMHLSAHQFMYTFVLGVLFAVMVYITKSIWAGILSHFIINGSQVSLLYSAMNNTGSLDAEVTLAQSMYDSFVGIDPEFAQRMYDAFANINAELFAVAIIGVIAIPAGIGVFFLFRALARHYAAKVVVAEEMPATEEVPVIAESEVDVPVNLPRKFKVDWCLIGIIVIFLMLMISEIAMM